MTALGSFWVHTCQVKTLQPSAAYGDGFAEPVIMPCMVEDNVRQVTDSNGTEVVSSTTVYAPLQFADVCRPGSIVIAPHEDPAIVIGVLRHEAGARFAALEHCEVLLR